jgi:hypothetical protein
MSPLREVILLTFSTCFFGWFPLLFVCSCFVCLFDLFCFLGIRIMCQSGATCLPGRIVVLVSWNYKNPTHYSIQITHFDVNTNFKVFGLIWIGLELTINSTLREHTNYYTINGFCFDILYHYLNDVWLFPGHSAWDVYTQKYTL